MSNASCTHQVFSSSAGDIAAHGLPKTCSCSAKPWWVRSRRAWPFLQFRHVFTAIWQSQEENFDSPRKLSRRRNARMNVSCARSAPSASEPVMRNVNVWTMR